LPPGVKAVFRFEPPPSPVGNAIHHNTSRPVFQFHFLA
jgi:hypothetical protein